jgi:hypothetical protein
MVQALISIVTWYYHTVYRCCIFMADLSCVAADLINYQKSISTYIYGNLVHYQPSASQAGCHCLLYMSPCDQSVWFVLIFGVANNNHIMASICEIWDFDCGEELDCCLSWFWHCMFLWVVTNVMAKPSSSVFMAVFFHEGGGSTFLQNGNHHLPKYAGTVV